MWGSILKNHYLGIFLSYAIDILVFTNIWIYSYWYLLDYLNKHFPFTPSTSFIVKVKLYLSPEPFEMPLYIILTIFLIVIIYIYFVIIKKIFQKICLFDSDNLTTVRIFTFLILSLFFLHRLGEYPMKANSTICNDTFLIYLLSILFIIIIMPILHYIYLNNRSLFRLSIFFFIILIISFFTFEPKFPFYLGDYSYFYGPIYELVNGKTIYTDITSQYGFIYMLIFALLAKLGFIKLDNLIYLIWLLYIVEYFLCFYLIYKISKSSILSIIGLFSILTINYFSLMHVPMGIPQVGPLRWIPMIIILLIFYQLRKIDSKILIFIIAFLSLLMIDSGIAILFSYLFSLFIFFLKKQISFEKIVKSIFYLFLSIFLILFIINGIHLIIGLKWIDLTPYFIKLSQYSREGFGMVKISEFSYFWIFILVYFASIIYFFRKNNINYIDELLILASNISFFGSIYYIGRSDPHNLFHISILFLVNLFLLLGIALTKLESNGLKRYTLILIFIFLIVFPAWNRQNALIGIINTKNYLFTMDNIFTPIAINEDDVGIDKDLSLFYEKEIALINNYLFNKKIVILSTEATYLFYLTNKLDLLNINPQDFILTKEELKYAIQDVVKKCPEKIVVDCRIFRACPQNTTKLIYENSIQPKILEEIERICHFKYKPMQCTNRLCIAQIDNSFNLNL